MASSPVYAMSNKASEMPVASQMKMSLCNSCDWVMPRTYHMGLAPPAREQGFGILATPDPTIASCISDEDAALQLMRLGEASNISLGRRHPIETYYFRFFFTYISLLTTSDPHPTHTCLTFWPLCAADSIFIRSHILKPPVHHNKMSTPNHLLRR